MLWHLSTILSSGSHAKAHICDEFLQLNNIPLCRCTILYFFTTDEHWDCLILGLVWTKCLFSFSVLPVISLWADSLFMWVIWGWTWGTAVRPVFSDLWLSHITIWLSSKVCSASVVCFNVCFLLQVEVACSFVSAVCRSSLCVTFEIWYRWARGKPVLVLPEISATPTLRSESSLLPLVAETLKLLPEG